MVTVAESRSGRTQTAIKLPVLIASALGDGPKGPPLVMLTGGPGGSSLDFAYLLAKGGVYAPLRQGRDVVLINERGVTGSQPTLNCTELDALIPSAYAADHTIHRLSSDASDAALAACYRRLTTAGVDLASYNLFEMANDIHEAVGVLGYPRYALYGVSFGTLFAQQVAKLFPAEVSSLVLDSPVPPSVNINVDVTHSVTAGLTNLFAACAADATCNATYPNLTSTFETLVSRLEDGPARPSFSVKNPADGSTYQAQLTGADVFGQVTTLIAKQQVVPFLPTFIAGLAKGEPLSLGASEALASQTVVPGKDDNTGMSTSIRCSQWPFTAGQLDDSVNPTLRRFTRPVQLDYIKQCQGWPVPDVRTVFPTARDNLASTTLPALVLTSRFDINIDPKHAREIAARLPHSFVHVFPDRGHIVATDGCAVSVIAGFLGTPTKDPDTACVHENNPAIAWQYDLTPLLKSMP